VISGGAFKSPVISDSTFKSPVVSAISTPTTSSASPALKRKSTSSTPKTFRAKFAKKEKVLEISENHEEKLERLLKEENEIDDEIARLENAGYQESEADDYIESLHEYNDIKDLAQMVIGKLAELEQVSVGSLHEEFDVHNIQS